MRTFATLALLTSSVLVGCDRSTPSQSASAAPAVPMPVVDAPATLPLEAVNVAADDHPTSSPATQITGTIILVDQKPLTFPPARLQLSTKSGQVVALLYSDDPKTAINDDFAGNSFYFSFPLQVNDVADIDGATYTPPNGSTEMQESPYGIFLDGNRQLLQPQMLSVKFEKDGDKVTVKIAGLFNAFDTTADNKPPRELPVSGRIRPEVVIREP